MLDILNELNKEANRLCNEIMATNKAIETETDKNKKAYLKGRVEALKEWLQHVEHLIKKILKKREEQKAAEREGKPCQ